MGQSEELASLRARVADLESQNASLRPSRGAGSVGGRLRPRFRAACAVVLVVLAALIAPVAVLGSWARFQLVDTDRFVATFAPLAEDPAVQSFVSDQAVAAIDEHLDVDGLVGSVFEGIDALELPPRAAAAVRLLEGPAAQGIHSMINDSVAGIVASPQFAQLWSTVLRETHARGIAVIQGDPDTALQLSDDGTLSLQLDTVIQSVTAQLLENGFQMGALIPEIERSIPILTSDSLVLVRAVYQTAVALGAWLPWLVIGLVVAGVALAWNRTRTLAWAGVGMAVSLLIFAAGLGVGRMFFLSAVSPSVMPASAAEAIYGQLIELMGSVITALVVLSIAIAVGAWLFGGSRPARALRAGGARQFARVRAAADRAGLDPRGFGRVVDRWRPALIVISVALGILAIFLSRPVSMGMVAGTLLIVAVVLLAVEVIRRPPIEPSAREARTDARIPPEVLSR